MTNKKKVKISCLEICNKLKLNKNSRDFVKKKYGKQNMFESEWIKILIKDRLLS